jgi:uncharacterized protein (TIGR02246 family)
MSQQIATNVHDEIIAANEVFMTAFKHGDAAALAKLYTDDGQVLPPNNDIVSGRDNLRGFWSAVMDMGVKEAKLETNEVDELGDTAVEVSTFKMFGGDDQLLDQGKYIVVWKKIDGRWLLHRDIFNSSMPPPG